MSMKKKIVSLPVAGIMSDLSAQEIGKSLRQIR
jgi:adenine deaminase